MTTVASDNKAGQFHVAAILQRFTAAHAILLLIAALGAVMRLSALSATPLSPAEAPSALAIWRFWHPGNVLLPAFDVSPGYFSLTALLFPILGDSDAVARLVPALFGVALIFLPWLARERLGTIGALTTSLLLAVSPTASILTITAGGDALALFALLLLLLAWLRYEAERAQLWLQLSAVALGMGLASSPLFYGGLVTLLVAWLVHTRVGAALGSEPSLDGQKVERAHLLRSAMSGVIVFVAISTLFLWRPEGLGAAATVFSRWLGAFGLQGTLSILLAPFLALVRYELIVGSLGAAAIFWASWRGRPLPTFLVYWFSAALILVFLQRGVVENVLLLVLPGYLLIGMALEAAFRKRVNLTAAGLFLALLVLGAIVYFNGARYLRALTYAPEQLSLLFLALLALVFAVVVINFVRSWDESAALQGTAAALLVLFLIFNWGTAWWLTHEARNDPREQWVSVGTDDDVLMLLQILQEVSWQVDGSRFGLEVHSGVDHPLLRWYLRDFENTSFGATVPPQAQQPAVIANEGADPALGADYLGSDLRLLQSGVTAQTPGDGLGETLRWWFFREQPVGIEKQRLVLWVRSDLLPR